MTSHTAVLQSVNANKDVACRQCTGTSPFVLHQGITFGDADLPAGRSLQPAMEACAQGCLAYNGTLPCVAWTYSSPWDKALGTCQLKGRVGQVRLLDPNIVSGHKSGEICAVTFVTPEYNRVLEYSTTRCIGPSVVSECKLPVDK